MNRESIFDAVREMLGRSFTSSEVFALDSAIDRAMGDAPALTLGLKGTALIKEFEGLAKVRPDGKVEAYPDPATGGAPWTIGYGSTGPDIKKGAVWTKEQAERRFAEHSAEFAAKVAKLLGDTPTTQEQFDAMVSLAYNVGMGNFAGSTLLKKHKAGDHKGAAAEFARWNRANGKAMAGLTRRRAAEAKLYRGQP